MQVAVRLGGEAGDDGAVSAAAQRKVPGSSERRRLANKVAAAVYSNRAVMNWLSLDAVTTTSRGELAEALQRNAVPVAAATDAP